MNRKLLAGVLLFGTAALAACGSANGSTSHSGGATSTPNAAVKVATTQLGRVLVNGDGHTLYGFTNDKNGASSCYAGCSNVWPPVTVAPGWTASADGARWQLHTVRRTDGSLQLAAGKWPLYTFAGDSAAGDVNGQGSGGTWFVVQPNAKLNTASAGMSAAGY